MRFLPFRGASTRLRRRPLAVCLAAALCTPPVIAGHLPSPAGSNLVVMNCDDAGAGSLRDVVASAHSGDTIDLGQLDCSLIALTGGAISIANDGDGQPIAALNLVGPGSASLTIDGGGVDRVFVHAAGTLAFLTITDLTITNGATGGNGGCVIESGTIELDRVAVTDCKAGVISGDATLGVPNTFRGGGIYASNAVQLQDSYVARNTLYGNATFAAGGGVFAVNAITMNTSTVADNAIHATTGSALGGGIAAGDHATQTAATVALMSSLISGNTAETQCSYCGVRGGGAWIYGSISTVDGEFDGNGASSAAFYGAGGALYFRGYGQPVSAVITGTHFHCNTADNVGGAIGAAGNLTISRSILDCNNAGGDGGAIELLGGNLTLSDSTVAGNIAKGRGGGIFLFGYGDIGVSNSTISGNVATSGGAIGNTYGSLHLSNSTIAFNQALDRGGGVWMLYAYYPFEMRSTIVAGNSDTSGANDLFPPGMTVTGANDLVVAADGVGLPDGTLNGDPLLAPLGPNGGPTPTHAPGEGSPAIDTGNNDSALEFDQRGPGFVRVYGAAADIGAFELQPVGPLDRIFADGFDP